MDPLEAGAAHQAKPQGIIDHGAPTVGQVQQGTDRPRMKNRHKVHMQLGEMIPVTEEMPAQGEVMWAKEKIVGDSDCRDAPNTEPLEEVTILRQDTQGMLRQWPQPLNP